MSGRGSNRGAYYKAKYARGSRSRNGNAESIRNDAEPYSPTQTSLNQSKTGGWQQLSSTLRRIDNKSYGAYKDLIGLWQHDHGTFTLRVDYVQSDPFAPPSRVTVKMFSSDAGFPTSLLSTKTRRIALADYLTRGTAEFITQKGMNEDLAGSGWKGPKGGSFNIHSGGQQVIERTSCIIGEEEGTIELRFSVRLPARGRTILGSEAETILVQNVPKLTEMCLLYKNLNKTNLHKHVDCVEEQDKLRSQLDARGLVAFIANGSILPRKSGAADLPMQGSSVIPFRSPPTFQIELQGLDGKPIPGMGIPKGVTIITGGGFHGKSTLLEAIQTGVWNVTPGDGREHVVTDATAAKIRAEDGRSVTGVDITPFIAKLPGKHSTQAFTTADASGSSSMSANIQEALEAGTKLLLVDEDTSATNLLVRDARMRALIHTEPITPFISRVRALYAEHGVSTILVVGSCGDYLDVADHVIGMQEWVPYDLGREAERVVKEIPSAVEQHEVYGPLPARRIRVPPALTKDRGPSVKSMRFIETREIPRRIVKNPSEEVSGVDLDALEQLVEVGQTRSIAEILCLLANSDGKAYGMAEILRRVEELIDAQGLSGLHRDGWVTGDMVRPRPLEIAAAISRVRSLEAE